MFFVPRQRSPSRDHVKNTNELKWMNRGFRGPFRAISTAGCGYGSTCYRYPAVSESRMPRELLPVLKNADNPDIRRCPRNIKRLDFIGGADADRTRDLLNAIL